MSWDCYWKSSVMPYVGPMSKQHNFQVLCLGRFFLNGYWFMKGVWLPSKIFDIEIKLEWNGKCTLGAMWSGRKILSVTNYLKPNHLTYKYIVKIFYTINIWLVQGSCCYLYSISWFPMLVQVSNVGPAGLMTSTSSLLSTHIFSWARHLHQISCYLCFWLLPLE